MQWKTVTDMYGFESYWLVNDNGKIECKITYNPDGCYHLSGEGDFISVGLAKKYAEKLYYTPCYYTP